MFGIYLITLSAAFVLYVILKLLPFVTRIWVCSRALRQFPMEDYNWLLGHLGVHPGPTHEGFMLNIEWMTKYPRYWGFYMGPLRPGLTLNHPEAIKQLLRTTEPKQMSLGGGYNLLLPWIGEGLLLSAGKKWARNRKLLTPGFHFDVLRPYIEVYNTSVEKLLNVFFENSVRTGRSMDIYKPVSLCTLDIILRCACSLEKDIQGKGLHEPYVDSTMTLGTLIFDRLMKPHLYFDTIYYLTKAGQKFKQCCRYSHSFSTSVIETRKKQLSLKERSINGSKKYLDFLDILLLARDEKGQGFTELEIRNEVETFLFEGHDTSASAISWLLYNLAKHPEIQEKARMEVDGLLSGRDSDIITWDDVNRMPYVTRCIKESLRLYPPIPIVGRQLSKPLSIDGKLLPVGSIIDIVVWNVHRNPSVWEEPSVYNPDRFLPEKMANMDPHAFIPFSAGPRNCIGQNFAMNEIKVTIARILRLFQFTLDESIEVKLLPSVSLRPKDGISLVFQSREKDADKICTATQ